jgi:3-deoxy-D-manno-octulosonic-acid transferase
MMLIYSLLLTLTLVVTAPWWLWRMAASGRYRAGLGERLGFVRTGLRAAVAGRPVVWVHAVSVGEVLAAARLIAELQAALPDYRIVVSTTTQTGQELAKMRLEGVPVFYMPLDFAFCVRRYLRVLQPRLLVLMESELWPRMLVECERRGTPVAVVNARVSDRSFPRYMRLRALWRPLLAKVSLFLAQGEETEERLRRIGAPSKLVKCVGNIKYDVAFRTEPNKIASRLGELLSSGNLIVAGSTLPGEEELLLQAWPNIYRQLGYAALLIAPRHPQRFQDVEELLRKSGPTVPISTEAFWKRGEVVNGTVFLLDTIGDLGSVYELADAAFVGGSMAAKGGHNPLEPARFGVPVIMGPSFENFREIVHAMQANDGIRIVEDRDELSKTLVELLTNREAARAMGERGRQVFESQSGATARTAEALLKLLQERVP